MANRVVMDADGIKISKPGENVLTAPNDRLNFTSDWSAFSILLTGTQNISWPTSSVTGSVSYNIPYGVTLPTPPVCQAEVDLGFGWTIMPSTGGSFASIGRNVRVYNNVGGGPIWNRTAFWRFSVVATPSRLEIRGNFDGSGVNLIDTNFFPANFPLRYTVFRYNF